MSCAECIAFDAAERAAIEGRELPTHGPTCACPDDDLDVLYVRAERFRRRPQSGAPCRVSWEQLAAYLAAPTVAASKDAAGAWSPARYRNNERLRANLMRASALVVDVDEGGDVERVASALGRYRCIVHSTFSTTRSAPRCRVVLALSSPLSADDYTRVHAVVRAHLQVAGIIADEAAKDASRLSFSPVVRHGGVFDFRTTNGIALDVDAVLLMAPLRPSSAKRQPLSSTAYARAALDHAALTVARAKPGTRHATLVREAFSVARLTISEHEIEQTLLPAFIVAAGEAARDEGVRTIRDAVRARRSRP